MDNESKVLITEADYIQMFKSLGFNIAQLRGLEKEYSRLANETGLENIKAQSEALKKII